MFLSNLVGKTVTVNKQPRGVCLGVGVSLKTQTVKYLLCGSSPTQNHADFAVSVSSVTEISDCIRLSRLRAVLPKNCAKLFLNRPIYTHGGARLGELADLEIREFTALRLFSDRGELFPMQSVFACSDAVILKKEPPYPLGQRVPAAMLYRLSEKSDGYVTKPLLRTAIIKGDLIKLTLSLPPFSMRLY